ncbi:hypothetical protein EV382_1694 [Micromonospora violae]|uniref:Uncharacterized protein n=1 Tax=Micromonospora violae TaxID=1278207 RepID=A0A4Q7UG53_9ACTN|nr:hypothetical protein [Micromonospora violae]RZT78509.1 hypothetical protein EV382_1694 [Micromonospora violae]
MNPFGRAENADTERLLDSAHARVDTGPDQGPWAAPTRTAPTRTDTTSPQADEALPTVRGADPVAALLAAAAGPARPGELAGEEAALAAFRAARANPTPSVVQRRRRRVTTGAVAWIGAVAATATAGAAFAAVTRDRAPEPVVPAPSRTSPSPPPDLPRSPEAGRSVAPGAPSPDTATPPAASASAAQLHGQCRAWQAKAPDQREKALRTPAFQRLVTAAGGPAEVEAYCQRLVPETKPTASAKGKPTASVKGKPAASAKAPPPRARPDHPAAG